MSGRTWLSKGAEVLAAKLQRNRANGVDVDCDVLIVGSGYGGAVAAARFAGGTVVDVDQEGKTKLDKGGEPCRRPISVWVLERGLEHLPGRFPSRFGELPGQLRFSSQDGKAARGYAEGLFDVRVGGDVSVLLGNGLGGGSLINAGVMERPHPRVFDNGWPAQLTAAQWDAGYASAHAMLQPEKLPEGKQLLKLTALMNTAMGGSTAGEFSRCEAAVSYAEAVTPAGVAMKACTHCGDCVTGCNQGAKRTLDTNYLAWAKQRGAQLYCGGWVELIERLDVQTWSVHWHYTVPAKRPMGGAPFKLRARHVVMAAGSLGSTEILLRSESKTLQFSKHLGHGFSTNGDMIAAGYRQKEKVNACGDEDIDPGLTSAADSTASGAQPAPARTEAPQPRDVGPTITGLIRTHTLGSGLPIAIEEFSVPAPLRRMMGEVTTTFGLLRRLFINDPIRSHPVDKQNVEDDLAVTTASLDYTSIYGLMGDDGASGRIELVKPGQPELKASDGQVKIVWSDKTALNKLFTEQIDWLERACKTGPVGGTVVPNPTWQAMPQVVSDAMGGPLDLRMATTVHPLGGCGMGNSAATGVVDHAGRVFDWLNGGVHSGLAVLDGAIVPKALGINPSFTIAALAEQALSGENVHGLPADWGIDLQPQLGIVQVEPPRPPAILRRAVGEARTGVTIRERLRGKVKNLSGGTWAVITIEFQEIENLTKLLRQRHREIPFGRATLRLYPRAPSEPVNEEGAAVLDGEMVLLAAARPVNRLRAWRSAAWVFQNRRGRAPVRRWLFDYLRGSENTGAVEAWAYLRHMRLRRTLRYVFRVVESGNTGLAVGQSFVGTKTIEFAKEVDPLCQFSTMALAHSDGRHVGILEADLNYFADRREALVNITAQRDNPSGLADVAAFAMLLMRVFMVTHLLHFVPSVDTTINRSGRRSPGAIRRAGADASDGIPPTLECSPPGQTFPKLTRYRPANPKGRPLLMIHGLSAAGSTFASEFLPCSLAKFMHEHDLDVWVLDLTTSSANGSDNPGYFSFEQVAEQDIPWAVRRVVEEAGQRHVDVVAHCIGSAMFCVAVLRSATLYQQIGNVVLSQVGPLPTMSPLNRLRGYLASYLEQFIAVDEFDTRPKEGLHIRILDALLASYPYPATDGEARTAAQVRAMCGDFRTVRHRVDAIMGQTMKLSNIAPVTLGALDAIYGWVNVRTLAQTIHFARHNVLTNADGDNEAVAPDRMAERFAFPVMLVHGRQNKVFDWRGSVNSYRALKNLFNDADKDADMDADPPSEGGNQHFGAGSRRQLLVLGKYGHQDTLIGATVEQDVFPALHTFLSREYAQMPPFDRQPSLACEAPWMGPMLGWTSDGPVPSSLQISMLVHPVPRSAVTLFVAIVPLQGRTGAWSPLLPLARGFRADDSGNLSQTAALRQHALRIVVLPEAMSSTAFAAVVLHDQIGISTPGLGSEVGIPLNPAQEGAVAAFFESGKDVEQCVFRLDRAKAARDNGRPMPLNPPVSFALASCQFPPGLLDLHCAQASYGRLLEDLSIDGCGPMFLLLCGDQVYLNAAAGVLVPDSLMADDVARRAYELNWRMPRFREVAARLPIYTMLNGYDVADTRQALESRSAFEEMGLMAFERYQAKLNPRFSATAPAPGGLFTYQFAPAGLPIFVLDTFSNRGLRSAGRVGLAKIVGDMDMAWLQRWLLHHKKQPVKFIVSPSVVLPVEPVDADHFEERLALNSWSGYPRSLIELLTFIYAEAIDGVVFLSGDAHLSMACKLVLAGGPTVYSVVSSGMYTPWPFANTRPADYLLNGAFDLTMPGDAANTIDLTVQGTMFTECVSERPGHAVLTVTPATPGMIGLTIEFRGDDEQYAGQGAAPVRTASF